MDFSLTTIWLIMLIVLVVVELFTLGLTTIWFAGGALIAFLLAWAGVPPVVQIIVFIIVSAVLLIFTRPLAVKYFNRSRTKTNVDSMIGATGIVTAQINNLEGTGTLMLKGQEWSARSEFDGEIIPERTIVEVLEVDGVKLIVKPKDRVDE